MWFFNYNKAVLAYQPWIHGLQANPTEITHQYAEDIWVDDDLAGEVTAPSVNVPPSSERRSRGARGLASERHDGPSASPVPLRRGIPRTSTTTMLND